VVGSAASAVQLIPEIAKVVGSLCIFQRTANWVLPKSDQPYTDAQLASFEADPSIRSAHRQQLFDLIDKGLDFTANEAIRNGAEQRVARRCSRSPIRHAAPADAGSSVGLQRARDVERLLSRIQPAERRARDRSDRAHRPGGHRHRGRHRAPRRHDRAEHGFHVGAISRR
jgi:cation diffusion facilitator CzcD-associated flavoprotein CzcO